MIEKKNTPNYVCGLRDPTEHGNRRGKAVCRREYMYTCKRCVCVCEIVCVCVSATHNHFSVEIFQAEMSIQVILCRIYLTALLRGFGKKLFSRLMVETIRERFDDAMV